MAENFIGRKASTLALFAALSFSIIGQSDARQTESDWWFDIEFIAFKREMLPNHPEDFSESNYQFSSNRYYDLFTQRLLKAANPVFRIASSLGACEQEQDHSLFSSLAGTYSTLSTSANDIQRILSSASSQTGMSNTTPSKSASFQMTQAFIELQQDWLNEANPQVSPLSCVNDIEYQAFEQVPQAFFKESDYRLGSHNILSSQQRNLAEFAASVFAQRDIKPLLHTVWRQQVVFGEENAMYYHILGGKKLTLTNSNNGNSQVNASKLSINSSEPSSQEPKLNRQAFIEQQLASLETALNEKQSIIWDISAEPASEDVAEKIEVKPEWELEGLVKVYLDYVNRVPYLHVDSEFKHSRLDLNASGEAVLEQYPLKQRRRIISKQIHYFDHPAFGIIIRLERYEPSLKTDTTKVIQ